MPEIDQLTPPRIGQPWPGQGGIYAGIMAGRDGQPDCHLIVSTAEHDLQDVAWGPRGERIEGAENYHDGRANTAAMAAAGLELAQRITTMQIDGHADWHLPSQAEMHLLAANLKDQFDQDDWYWTSTQCSANNAWGQDFYNGFQLTSSKDYEGRGRPVRQIQINP